jgi:uncharacterized hydrophobic protein (TIGR00271 family)
VSDSLQDGARNDASLSRDYVVLTVASAVIATFGLIENSVAVIIGAMIIAPLMGPIQSFAYAALAGDFRLVRQALVTAAVGVTISVSASALLGLATALPSYGSEVLARTTPTVLDLGIAVAAGGIAGYARIRTSIAGTIAGTAIAVALMPPLCVVGLSLAIGQWSNAKGAAVLFATNFLGIALACMLVYLLARRFEAHGKVALLTTLGVTAALVFPLGASFYSIVRDSRIEAEIRRELVENTVTFRQVRLVAASFDWYAAPVTARLEVRAAHPVTPSQVGDLENFIASRTGQHVHLVVRVSRYETVDDTAPEATGLPNPKAT